MSLTVVLGLIIFGPWKSAFTAHVRAVRNRLQELGQDTGDPVYKKISRELSHGIGEWGVAS